MNALASWIVNARSLPPESRPRIVDMLDGYDPSEVFAGMESSELAGIRDAWDLWSLPHQRMPEGNWRRWMMIGGRGIGKTYTSSKTATEVAKDKDSLCGGIIGIMGRTHTDVRETNVEAAASGIIAAAPDGWKPSWRPGPGVLTWPNGVRGRVFSADSPESVLGSNIAFMIGDELARYPNGGEMWSEIVELAVRIGRSQIMITTTPKPLAWLRKLVAMNDSIVTGASTYANPFLSAASLESFVRVFRGTRLEREALFGEFVERVEGALLKWESIEDNRLRHAPELVRVVVSIDPAVTAHKRSDMTGLVVYGVDRAGHGFVLEDATGKYSITKNEWAEVAVKLYHKWEADLIIGERNRGGDMVAAGIRAAAASEYRAEVDGTGGDKDSPRLRTRRGPIPYQDVKATRGKMVRADPVGALYELGRIHHVGVFPDLESELTTWIVGDPSPNRLDALVYAATHLQLSEDGPRPWATPLAYLGIGRSP